MKSLTEKLRAALRAEAKECPTCGHMDRSSRELARALGLSSATLWRFMAGKKPSAQILDVLYERYKGKLSKERGR